MKISLIASVAAVSSLLFFSLSTNVFAQKAPQGADKIVTGPDRGAYIEIGRDIAKFVAEPLGVKFDVLPSKGSTENIRRLRDDPGVRLATVQSDVYQAFLDEAKTGNADALHLIEPLRVFMPLYREDIYFVVRADSPINYIHQIKDKKINLGQVGGGAALSATTIYRQMFHTPMPSKNVSFLSNEDALLKLVTDRTIDVTVVVSGQPNKLFSDMKSEAQQYIKLLKFDPNAPESKAIASIYTPSMIHASHYSNWLQEDVPTLSVRAMLVTYNYGPSPTRNTLVRLAGSLCTHFDRLRTEGHAEWQQIDLSNLTLEKKWAYYAPTEKIVRECHTDSGKVAAQAAMSSAPPNVCTQTKMVLGLCQR
jgi:TRAP transporter TAXI family solute receptor